MDDLCTQDFYKNLSYQSKILTNNIIESHSYKKKVLSITSFVLIILFIVTMFFIRKYYNSPFKLLCILLSVLLLINFIYVPMDSANKNFNSTKSAINDLLKSKSFCKCHSNNCNCSDKYLEYLSTKKGIKLF